MQDGDILFFDISGGFPMHCYKEPHTYPLATFSSVVIICTFLSLILHQYQKRSTMSTDAAFGEVNREHFEYGIQSARLRHPADSKQ